MTFQRRQKGNLQKHKTISHLTWTPLNSISSSKPPAPGCQHCLVLRILSRKEAVSLKQDSNNHFLFQVHLEAFQDLFAYQFAQDSCTNMLLPRKTGTLSMVKNNTGHQSTSCKLLPQFDIKMLENIKVGLIRIGTWMPQAFL